MSNQPLPISAKDIQEAAARIAPFVHNTPVVGNASISKMAGAEVFFKCENLQKVGAFKARGAMNAALQLSAERLKKGLATHSSGNHGQALAWAAAQLGTTAFVVMPNNSPQVKIDAVRGYGAEVIFCEPTLAAREEALQKVVAQTGAYFVHPYNDLHVIAGQATVCYELLQQKPDLSAIFCPIGGGGLISGTLLSAHYFSKKTKVIGCEPLNANDAWQSWQAKKHILAQNPNTIADGLKTSLGALTYPILMQLVHLIYTVSEAEIAAALRLVLERTKMVIEPSAAVGVAALMQQKKQYQHQKVGVILCGGNIDLADISKLITL